MADAEVLCAVEEGVGGDGSLWLVLEWGLVDCVIYYDHRILIKYVYIYIYMQGIFQIGLFYELYWTSERHLMCIVTAKGTVRQMKYS